MIDQLILGIFGPAAVIISHHRQDKIRRIGCLVGMFTQPFWFYTSFMNEQWGVFAAAFFYTYGWGLGIYNLWIKQ